MWEPDLPFAVREECVRTMADLFKNLFAAEPLDTSVQMWWDFAYATTGIAGQGAGEGWRG